MSDGAERINSRLNCTLLAGLWAILQEHSRKTNEPVSHIVSRALAEYLQVSHSTLYQVSTATALVEGIYQAAVRVRTLREHGDLGLGTFENLDGEMVIVDGHFFQVRSDHRTHWHYLGYHRGVDQPGDVANQRQRDGFSQ
jgi:acetolactate decarboxylase